MFDAIQNTEFLFSFRNSNLSVDHIVSRLDVNTEAGTVFWKPEAISKPVTGEAGTVFNGERVITFEGVKVTAAELVWSVAHNGFAVRPVSYIDGDVTNAALSNLYLKDAISSAKDIPYHLRRTQARAAELNTRRCRRNEIPASPYSDLVYGIIASFRLDQDGNIRDLSQRIVRPFDVDGLPFIEFNDEQIEAADVVIALTEGVLPEFVCYLDGNPQNYKRSNLTFVEAE